MREQALALGFDAVGFAAPHLAAEARAHLTEFLARGYHGDMGWLASRAAERSQPKDLWPEVKTVAVLGMNYGPQHDPLAALERRQCGTISAYAQNRDYHDLVKSRLKALARAIAARWPGALKVFVDTAPVMEKPLAAQAGLGWQGKHTNLVSRAFGSWLFLGEIYLSLQAFPAHYRLDARRCISYLTIEHKGHIARELRPMMGNRIYGCDDCLAVCPWNKFAQSARASGLAPRPDLRAPALAELAGLDDAAFRARFSGSPIKRIGRNRFLRNVLIAIGNSGEPELAAAAEARLSYPSPLVRAVAVWALRQLTDETRIARLRAVHLATEADAAVREEWEREP